VSGVGEHLGEGAHRVQPVGTAPEQGARPQVLEQARHDVGPGGLCPEQLGHGLGGHRRPGDEGGLEHLEVGEVEAVHGPLQAGSGAGAGGEGGQVRRRRAGQVVAEDQQRAQLLVGASADVVRHRAGPGGGGR